MVIPTTELSLITVGMKGGAKGLHTFVGTNVGILCQRTTSVPAFLPPPTSATSRSRFSTCALIQRNNSSPRSTYSDVEFRGAVCTIGTYYPAKRSWGCKVKPATDTSVMDLVSFLVLVILMLWEMIRTKKLKRQIALFLLGICICLAIFAAKGNKIADFIVTTFDKAGKIFKVLGHLYSIFGGAL